jgi:hypothetical protein
MYNPKNRALKPVLLCLSLALSAAAQANHIPKALSQYLDGAATDNQSSKASFAIGVTADDGKSFGFGFAKWQTLDILTDMRVAPEHVGKSGSLYIVAKYNEDWYMKNSAGDWVNWNLQLDALVNNQGEHALQATESVAVQKQLTNLPGKFQIFVGYKVGAVIHYNAQGFNFKVAADEKPTPAPDTQKPTITLAGANPLSVVQGTAYTEPGATWTDNVDGTGAVTAISGTVNTATVGTYTVTYSKTDAAGNTQTATRTVNVTPFIFGKLNDTGITACANEITNGLACPQATHLGQDAQSGRDVTHNDNSDGHAGFSFTKVNNTGASLAASAMAWNCVKDNVTGLMWEVKTDDNGLHDKDWSYTWYESNTSKNGGNAGTQTSVTAQCGNTSACNTTAYVQAVNAAGWCGHNDWRMPTVDELSGITALDRVNPAIDTHYFPNTVSTVFWSSSSYAGSSSMRGASTSTTATTAGTVRAAAVECG